MRIPFIEAISEPLLLKKAWETQLSLPQQVCLSTFYGLPLKTEEELTIWSALQGEGIYDDLGFLTGVHRMVPYVAKEYESATMVVGRRVGKSHKFSSFIVAYEALCGGHSDRVSEKQDYVALQIGQDLQTARANLRQFIIPYLESSKIGAKELFDNGKLSVTADTARLKSLRALITVAPPTVKIRSQGIAVCAMDELCVWPSGETSANPDFEVENAVRPSLMQFYPYGKLVKTSTPWIEDGLLWRDYNTGTNGSRLKSEQGKLASKNFLLIHGTTALMRNPRNSREYLAQERDRDPKAFEREYLGKFANSLTGFLSSSLLLKAVENAPKERAFDPRFTYVAAMDPAFRHDSFAFTICHWDPKIGIVQDVVRRWSPEHGERVSPAAVLDEVSQFVRTYNVVSVSSDQYQFEALHQLSADRGFFIEGVDFTAKSKAKIYGNFESLLNQKRIRLLDHPAQFDELRWLEKNLQSAGGIKIAAPTGKHDDLASALALCVFKATGLVSPDELNPEATKHKTTEELVWAFSTPKTPHWWE